MTSHTMPVVSPETLAAFKKARPEIVKETVARILQYADWQKMIGETATEILTSGIDFTAITLEGIMLVTEPVILQQQLTWGKEYLTGVGIPPANILRNMEILAEVTGEKLPESQYPGLQAWLQAMISVQKDVIAAGV